MLSAAETQSASDLLWRCWQDGETIAALPGALRPATRAEGYAIQARLEARSRRALFGWKIAATSRAGQAHINVSDPLAGRLLGEHVSASGADLPFGTNHMKVAELEFAFRLGRALPPRGTPYHITEVMGAVEALHPAIEIPDSRFADFTVAGAPQLIADNACAHRFVLGDAATAPWRNVDLRQHRVVCRIGRTLEREGKGENVLGDPRLALTWLANELSHLGLPLAAGQVVSTGTCLTPVPIAPGDEVFGDFGIFGAVSVGFRCG
jgi:2-keto-4-pentenoate hydratase